MIYKKLFTLICLFNISFSYCQNSFLDYSDTINKPRVIGVSCGQASFIGLSSIGLYSLWYSKESKSKFHFLMIGITGVIWIKLGIFTVHINFQKYHLIGFRGQG